MALLAAMLEHQSAQDSVTLLVGCVIKLAILVCAPLTPTECRILAAVAAAEVTAWLLAALLPPRLYRRSWVRHPVVAAVRAANTVVLPVTIDGLRILRRLAPGGGPPAAPVAASVFSSLRGSGGLSLGASTRALVMLLLPVCWIHSG